MIKEILNDICFTKTERRLKKQAMKAEGYVEGWNAAIEAAAKWLEIANRNDTDDAEEIRKLKK